MAKLMIKAIGLFALTIAYAGGAWAACTDVTTDPGNPATQLEVCAKVGPAYAADLFGAGSDDVVLAYRPDDAETGTDDAPVDEYNGPKVIIELPETVAVNSSAEISYTLSGAVFADRVRASDLALMHVQDTNNLRVTDISDGAAGDDEVIFSVQATTQLVPTDGGSVDRDATNMTNLPNVDKALIVFTVPYLTQAATAMTTPLGAGITVTVDVASADTGTGGFKNFPERRQTRNRDLNKDEAADVDTGTRPLIAVPTGRGLVVVSADGAENGVINPEMREVLSFVPPRASQQLVIAGVSLDVAETLAQSSGTTFSVSENKAGAKDDDDGAGVLTVAAAGDFRGRRHAVLECE